MSYNQIKNSDPTVYEILKGEDNRQQHHLELIASENFVSKSVMEAYTSTLTNKYAEGYPGKRYYGGCEFADKIETLAIERAKQIFNVPFANVQPHSGAQANMTVFFSTLQPGDTFLGMDLSHGGHLTHGSKVNYSGLYYNVASYGVSDVDYKIDYKKLEEIALQTKPKLIIAGGSAYPRTLHFDKFAEIAKKVGALLMVDMAHIAGLVAANLHPSPVPYADFVTTTTHKTLRGPRGGMILTSKEEHAKKINSRLFPGVQGGPLMHVIAAKAVAFGEALTPKFKEYQQNVINNTQTLAQTLLNENCTIVSGGTDNHLILLDVFKSFGLTGKDAEVILEKAGLTTNKNTLPFDTNPPAVASGIRLGTPALTTRGFGKEEFIKIGKWITLLLKNPNDDKILNTVKYEVNEVCNKFPMTSFLYNA